MEPHELAQQLQGGGDMLGRSKKALSRGQKNFRGGFKLGRAVENMLGTRGQKMQRVSVKITRLNKEETKTRGKGLRGQDWNHVHAVKRGGSAGGQNTANACSGALKFSRGRQGSWGFTLGRQKLGEQRPHVTLTTLFCFGPGWGTELSAMVDRERAMPAQRNKASEEDDGRRVTS